MRCVKWSTRNTRNRFDLSLLRFGSPAKRHNKRRYGNGNEQHISNDDLNECEQVDCLVAPVVWVSENLVEIGSPNTEDPEVSAQKPDK